MTLSSGTKLSHYEILEPIGAGGMGEVYRARDTKLGREVAIKVLPEELSRDRERLARFEREAKLLAALNHPAIAHLYGFEEESGTSFLVMELVEGETLADRIARGPIPIDEAIPLFIQIAEGIEAAHDKGIVHRDLKPANIMITPEGKVKILDFGLAKAFADEEREPLQSSLSPTLTKGTALGTILGTASYMSPEQARGKAVDKRTDVWAFGCCVYESVTGKKTFDGETVTDILAAVVKTEPDWAGVPTTLRRLLRRCLAKDPRRRLKDIADARLELEEPEETVVEPTPARRSSLLPWILTAASLVAATGLLVSRGAREAERVHRFQVALPEFLRLNRGASPVISPDGERIVFTAIDESGRPTLWLRSFDALEVQKLAGTEGAGFPFWSPDSRRVGFFAESELCIVDLEHLLEKCAISREGAEEAAPGTMTGSSFSRTGVGSHEWPRREARSRS